ncbi:unnamed protein product, partial [Gadus morhua 'NCC']
MRPNSQQMARKRHLGKRHQGTTHLSQESRYGGDSGDSGDQPPSSHRAGVDKDLLVVLTCRDGLLVGVSGVATASPAGVLKAGRARVEPRGVSAGTASRGASAWANPWPGVVPEGVGDVQRMAETSGYTTGGMSQDSTLILSRT